MRTIPRAECDEPVDSVDAIAGVCAPALDAVFDMRAYEKSRNGDRDVRWTLAIAGGIRRLARFLHFHEVPPGIGLRAIEIGEAIDPGQAAARQRLSVPARPIRIRRER